MSDRTCINPIVSDSTLNNNQFQGADVTSVNQVAQGSTNYSPGTVLLGKFEVVQKMNISTGEADLYICRYQGKGFVAKVYRRTFAVKPDVVERLKNITSPFIARLFESGKINGLPVEIIPYYKRGSLQGKKFSFEELKTKIIPSLNEGLHTLHQNGVIHKDLKPSNIMISSDELDIVIIDFGISSIKDDGNTVIVTRTGMTPEYSAPETFRNLFLDESDYYSLGITIYELFFGYTPYKDMSAETREQFIAVQRLPFPENIPSELKDVITALTYTDITYRKDKNNPNRRWTYNEVKRWCKGEKLPLPGEGLGNRISNMPPYTFAGREYLNPTELADALGRNWSEGKKHLFKGLLTKFYANHNPEIALIAQDAEDEAARLGGKDDVIFWGLLYRFAPELRAFYWRGKVYESIPAFGRDILEHLWNKDEKEYEIYDSVLTERLLSKYVQIHDPENETLYEGVKALEDAHLSMEREKNSILLSYYKVAYMLSGYKALKLECGKEVHTIGELADFMKSLLELSYDKFETFCHGMIDYEERLNPQLEAWLIALGKRQEIEYWRKELAE